MLYSAHKEKSLIILIIFHDFISIFTYYYISDRPTVDDKLY